MAVAAPSCLATVVDAGAAGSEGGRATGLGADRVGGEPAVVDVQVVESGSPKLAKDEALAC